MDDLMCPHCHGNVSRGAFVCRGCQAEVEYGPPPAAYICMALLSAFLGFQLPRFLPDFLSFAGWIAGIGIFIVGSAWIRNIFKDRVNFKRIYRTKK